MACPTIHTFLPCCPSRSAEKRVKKGDISSNCRKNLLQFKKNVFVLLTLGCWFLTIGLAVRRNKTPSARKIFADLPLQSIQSARVQQNWNYIVTELDLLILSSKVDRNQCHFFESHDWVVLVRTHLFLKGLSASNLSFCLQNYSTPSQVEAGYFANV